uniref:Uncharacterized protein n=1 Tax=Romanomermis culicivorax TaxID=13658 RepID=A0A915KML7_ROMCU
FFVFQSAAVRIFICKQPFSKAVKRSHILFASKRFAGFCVVDVQATVDHSLYYRSHSARTPVLFAVTPHLVKICVKHFTFNQMDVTAGTAITEQGAGD